MGTLITSGHLFFMENKTWKATRNIRCGDKIVTSSNKVKKVEEITSDQLDKYIKIYNLNVEDNHTYYVGSNGLLVHNSCTTIDLVNSFGTALYWVEKDANNIKTDIKNCKESVSEGTRLEAEVAEYVNTQIRCTNFILTRGKRQLF